MPEYRISTTWKHWGYTYVDADSFEEAVEAAQDAPLPDNDEFVEDSFEVDECGHQVYDPDVGDWVDVEE